MIKNNNRHTSFLSEAEKYMATAIHEEVGHKQVDLAIDLIKNGSQQEITKGVSSRAHLVSTQAAIELLITNMMRGKKLSAATCVIHTPRPSTPLLINTMSDISDKLASKAIINDAKRYKTITDRAKTLRKLLAEETCVPVVSLYHESSLTTLTSQQKEAYERNQSLFSSLEDKPVDNYLTNDKEQFTGATYVVQDTQGKRYMYSIQSFQANTDDTTKRNWGVWCGEYKPPELRQTHAERQVGKRLDSLQKEIFKPHGVDIDSLLQKSMEMQQSLHIGSMR